MFLWRLPNCSAGTPEKLFEKNTRFPVHLLKSPLIVDPAWPGMRCRKSLSNQGSLEPMAETYVKPGVMSILMFSWPRHVLLHRLDWHRPWTGCCLADIIIITLLSAMSTKWLSLTDFVLVWLSSLNPINDWNCMTAYQSRDGWSMSRESRGWVDTGTQSEASVGRKTAQSLAAISDSTHPHTHISHPINSDIPYWLVADTATSVKVVAIATENLATRCPKFATSCWKLQK